MLFPATYIKWREPLCVWCHVVHKLAQTAVTLVPPVGTIFSPSYNPTGARPPCPQTHGSQAPAPDDWPRAVMPHAMAWLHLLVLLPPGPS